MTTSTAIGRVLVTGGAGFIGTHLVHRLAAAGCDVVVLDDLSSGDGGGLSREARLVVGSVLDRSLVADVMADVDTCFHLAAIASIAHSTEHYVTSHQVNLAGFVNVIDAIRRRYRKTRLVYASSAAVYGDSPAMPWREDGPAVPISPYGADKRACEIHGHVARRVYGIPSTGLRFFNVYGPGQSAQSPYAGVVSKFIASGLGQQKVTLFGDGSQTRDFIHVTDVVDALVGCAAAPWPDASIFNVCSGDATSLRGLAELIGRCLATMPAIEHAAERPAEVRHSVGDPARLQQAIGFRPTVRLTDGLADLVGRARA